MPATQANQVADGLLARLSVSPDAYPHKVDFVREEVLLLGMDTNAYSAASFLDDRILTPTSLGAWAPTALVEGASRACANLRPLHFIFHAGHVGSTLLSRLLDETGTVLSLREPLPLRTLAEAHDQLGRPESLLSEAQFDVAMALFVRLWRRGYPATRSVVVKATSSSGRLAVPLLRRNEGMRAIYLNLRAEPYLATLLAGRNSPLDLRAHSPERMRRLQTHLTTPLAPLHTLSVGQITALSWLVERFAQQGAVGMAGSRVVALDFDFFLNDVRGGMAHVLDHLGIDRTDQYLTQVNQSPALTRYSKAPEFPYTPALRNQVLQESRRDNAEEIRKGMAWLVSLAKAEPTVAAVLNSATA